MNKKDFLIAILTKLLPYWDLAEGFLVLVRQSDSVDFVEDLYSFIKRQISSIQDAQEKQKIIVQIKTIKSIKLDQEHSAQKDCEEADNMLEDFINDVS